MTKRVSQSTRVIAYHWGKRPAVPAPWNTQRGEGVAGYADGLIDGLVVFLCKHPAEIPVAHGLDGNLYIYEVPSWVFRKSGGWRRYDNATELVIPAELWKEVRFLGRSKKEEQFRRLADKFFSSNLMRDLTGNRPSKHSSNSITDEIGE